MLLQELSVRPKAFFPALLLEQTAYTGRTNTLRSHSQDLPKNSIDYDACDAQSDNRPLACC